MKQLVIFYFSGTGNTEIVAGLIGEEFRSLEYAVETFRMEDVLKNKVEIDVDRYDLIGIGHPVYGCGSPKIVSDFIVAMPDGNGKRGFIFGTAGGVVPQNYFAFKQTMSKLTRKGYSVNYQRLFSLGSNWVVKFKESVSQVLYQAARRKVKLMCEEIAAGKLRIVITGFPLSVLSGTIKFLHDLAVRFIGKDYRVTHSCNHCGKCVRNCPTANIYEKNVKIKFKSSCLWCMRCIYGCPQKAIQHRLLSFAVVPGGYDIQKILDNPDLGEECAGLVPPFFEKYQQNDNF